MKIKMLLFMVVLFLATEAKAYWTLYDFKTVHVPEEFASIAAVMEIYWPIEGKPITIVLSEGTFDEFVCVPSHYGVVIRGQGPGKTVLANSGPQPQVIYAALFGKSAEKSDQPPVWYDRSGKPAPSLAAFPDEPDKTGGTNPLWLTEEEVWGSYGGWEVRLEDLTVYNPAGKRNEAYSDAAVFCEGSIHVKMRNVEIVSESNPCFVSNYEDIVRADHCAFIAGDPEDAVVSTTHEWYVDFSNSLLLAGKMSFRCSNGVYIAGTLEEPVWTDIPSVRATNCCAWGYADQLGFCLDDPDWTLDASSFVPGDPQFMLPRLFLPSSPCLGAATDGGNVGIYKPVVTDPEACDPNGDGKVDSVDIQWVINAFLGCLPEIDRMFADVNGDGKCDAVDIQRVINAVLGRDCDGNP